MTRHFAFLLAAAAVVVPLAGQARAATTGRRRVTPRHAPARPSRSRVSRNPFGPTGRRSAFSNRVMGSKQELENCLQMDPKFRNALKQQYHMTDSELMTYVQDNLQYFKLQRAQRMTVYGMRRNGQVFRVQ